MWHRHLAGEISKLIYGWDELRIHHLEGCDSDAEVGVATTFT